MRREFILENKFTPKMIYVYLPDEEKT
jgi:hypothetical protein